jgi:hypothetical protein
VACTVIIHIPTTTNVRNAILADWSHSGFDPWSDGKDAFSTSFVRSLFVDRVTGETTAADANADQAGLQQQSADVAGKNKLAQDLNKLFSWARHEKYDKINDFLAVVNRDAAVAPVVGYQIMLSIEFRLEVSNSDDPSTEVNSTSNHTPTTLHASDGTS